MIKVKDGYAKLIGTTYQGSATQVLLSNGGDLEYSASSKASTLVQRNASQHIYATYFNSAISDEALTNIGSVYVRNTSDTFIRRVSKTQFYSILDDKFVTLDTAQTITGVKTFSTGPILANNATITQNQNSTSNYTTVVKWLKGGTSQGTYNPSIGQHNTGGDGTGSICILPYPTSTNPLGGTVGLFIGKGVLRLDGKAVAIAENYYTKTESDKRYVNVTGDTMTGTLTSASTNNAIIFKGLENCDITNFYTMNGTLDSNSRLAIRNGLRFNWYDTYWYIGNIRGESTNSNGFGIANESHKLCLQVTPNNTIAPVFRSTASQGTAPLIVNSTTQVSNLNADLLDGYHAFGTSNALIKYGYTVGGTEPTWCRIATYSIRNTEIMTDVCFVLHSAFGDLFGLLVVRTRGTSYVQGKLMVAYNINTSNIRIYHDAEKRNIELYCHGGNHYSIIQANLLYSHDRYGEANTNITLHRKDTKAPSWSTYVNPVFVPLQNSSEAAKKLQTPRTLWGQSFDGTANVSGNMTGVGSITMSGDLKIGNGTSPNTIYFYGTTGDSPGGYNHTFIAERIWGGTESSELVLFKGNNLGNDNEAVNVSNGGPDRIRHIAAAHLFQTYTSPLSGSVKDVCTSSALRSLFGIAANRVTSYVPFMSTVASGTAPFIVASNTVVGNLNADLLDGFHENSFLRYYDIGYSDGYNTLWEQIGIRQYNRAKPDEMANPIYNYGAVISLPGKNARLDIWYNHMSSASGSPTNGIQYRSGWNTDRKPWRMLLDSVNYVSCSDGRYVKKAGDTMTGDLTMNNTKGFNIGWSTRVVKDSGVWIHGGADAASSADANLRFGSWYGIGWYPTFSRGSVARGNNAMWLNVRTGVLDVHSNITSHNGYLAANWDSARRLVLGGGSSYAWIDLRDSSNNSVLNNIVLYHSYTGTGKEMRAPYFKSTVGTGTQPYQCNSTTLNTHLNADMLDNWHLNFLPRNYNSTRTYAVRFALGNTDNNWKKIFACSESGVGPYKSVTVWGRIWYAYGSHAQSEVRNYHFCAIFYMRSGPSSSNSSVGTVENSARLYLPTFAKRMDNIRLVRVGTNNFELQVRQIGSYHNANIEYQYWSCGCNVSAWEGLQSTSNTSVAVSAGGASTLADSRASSADVWTSARTFYIQDHNASHTGAGVSVNGSSNVYLKLPSSIQCSNWFRSTGNSGWYHQNYGGGWYMSDSTWIRTYGSKSVYQNTGQIRTDGYLVTNRGLTAGATSPNNQTYKLHVTGASWSSGLIRAGGGFYHNSVNSNSYVLLAGGSYKGLGDFAKGNAGSATKGVYVTGGTVRAMTYYLNATVNSGASGKLAYYSGTNSIDDYTNTIGSSSTPIYINNGIPNAANRYKVVNRGHYFSAFGISGYIYVIRYGQVVCVSINMYSHGNGSTGTTTLLTNLPSAVYTTGQSASKGGGSALRQATFYVSGKTLYVYSYQANYLPDKVSFTYITNTPE